MSDQLTDPLSLLRRPRAPTLQGAGTCFDAVAALGPRGTCDSDLRGRDVYAENVLTGRKTAEVCLVS